MTQQLKPWLTDEMDHAVAESAAWAELARALAIPLAIEADAGVRRLLRQSSRIGEATPFAIGQPDGLAWLAVEGQGVTAHRRRPEGMPAVDLGALLAREPRVFEALRSALTHGTALTAAATVLGTLMGPAEVLSRQKFLYLQSWAPVLERHAYKSAAAMAASLDLMRPQALPNLRAVVGGAIGDWHRVERVQGALQRGVAEAALVAGRGATFVLLAFDVKKSKPAMIAIVTSGTPKPGKLPLGSA